MRDQCTTCGRKCECTTGKSKAAAVKYEVLYCPSKTARQRPNKIESIIDEGTANNCLYTGDGKFWVKIGSQRMRNPDFIIENTNKVIEVFGDYWHRNDSPDEVINEYANAGLDCLVIWEKEIVENKQRVFSLIQKFECR